MSLHESRKEKHNKLTGDFRYFAEQTLKVNPAGGGAPIPFILNKSQIYVNHVIEEEIKKKGLVRAIILKARRHGISTLIGGRHYQGSSMQEGVRTIIIAHDSKTTRELFDMIKGFRDNAPEALKPEIEKSNAQELAFSRLNSKYSAMTAGSTQTGRGFTAQRIHATEVAFYQDADALIAGVLQTVEHLPGTEIIFESTAKGKGNRFHSMCMQALREEGDFKLIFCPWYWHDSYSREAPQNFRPTREEEEMMREPNNVPELNSHNEYIGMRKERLTIDQIYWRRMKILEFRTDSDSEGKFKQEYPGTVEEAFQRGTDRLILASKINTARKSTIRDDYAAMVMGCDLARGGNTIAITYRKGRVMERTEIIPNVEISSNPTLVLAELIGRRITDMDVSMCFIDYGHGHGVYDLLRNLGYGDRVQLVHFGQQADNRDAYRNKRTEMYARLRDWLHEEEVSIPDEEEIEVQLSAPTNLKENGKTLYLESKEELEKKSGIDMGIADSIALTFATEVIPRHIKSHLKRKKRIKTRTYSTVKEEVRQLLN